MRIPLITRFGLALLLVLVSSAAAFADTIKITTDRALVWNKPNGVAVVITQLKRDDTVEVVRKLNGWYEIIVPGNSMSTEVRIGYVSAVAGRRRQRRTAVHVCAARHDGGAEDLDRRSPARRSSTSTACGAGATAISRRRCRSSRRNWTRTRRSAPTMAIRPGGRSTSWAAGRCGTRSESVSRSAITSAIMRPTIDARDSASVLLRHAAIGDVHDGAAGIA